ncbi:MAG: glycosyl hydrolase [Gammaproteobacteria bacterium]|nr:glycosyl hydrolase [Gammaproteobacteria bacterium]
MTDRGGKIHVAWLLALLASLPACGDISGPEANADQPAISPAVVATPDKLLVIGQDLGAIRGYMGSDCCPQPDGLTAYIDFYDILTEDDFGGLGIDADGNEVDFELDWNAGPVSAYRTATEFGIDGLAIGLSITENEHPGGLQRLVDGKHDDEIRQLARFFSMIEGPVYLRIGYEFDGAWNQGYENAPSFIAAWKRIVDVLREENADNVVTVWQTGAAVVDEVIDQGHEDIAHWYPGDDYVDWMGFSWFMNPREMIEVPFDFDPGTPLQLAEELLAFARERGKPVMIAEASPQAMDLDENFMAHHTPIWDGESASNRVDMSNKEIWDHWFAPLFALMNDNRDVIHVLAYINVDWDSQAMWGPPYANGFWGDSRLEVNADIAARFAAAIDAWKNAE